MDEAHADLTGTGEAANGLIRAAVGPDGRLRDLYVHPQVLGATPYGPVMEACDLPEEIKKAVNAALDDLEDKIRQSTGDLLGELGADLERVTENFERAIDQIHRYRPSPKPAAVLAPVPVRGSGS